MGKNQMIDAAIHQLKNGFLLTVDEEALLFERETEAYGRALNCVEKGNGKYFLRGGRSLSPWNSVMHCIYLYWLSRTIWESGHCDLADKIYCLNKAMNAVDLFYEVEMPPVWGCEHPVGSVVGRGRFGNYFFFYQGCTVGGNRRKDGTIAYPVIGKHVTMFSDSKVIGDSHIGDHTFLSANSYVINENIPAHSIVFGQSPYLIIKENTFL